MKGAVFLDRDGTLNPDAGYISRAEDFFLFEETPLALRKLVDAGYPLVVVTNQSGVARRLFSLEELHEIHAAMEKQLAEHGVFLTAIYGCPHHPEENCRCRKPGIGMFERASKEHGIDLRGSFMVGDSLVDVQAGRAAGCQTIWIDRKYPNNKDEGEIRKLAHYTAESLMGAVDWMLKLSGRRE
ncbi:MAG: HAD family hydrolase [Deltaproteobacteria bacterium]|nr:HAD family hydrolase [Deltaproteobacteria bacterium]